MTTNNNTPTTTDGFCEGDRFCGLVVADYEDKEYHFTVDGTDVHVIKKQSSPLSDRLCVGFLFLLEKPVRFRLDVLVPEDCYNANCTLNDKELLGFFSKEIPENPEYSVPGNCGGSHEKYTTLAPGKFQSINFRWESGDVLKFFFYFKEQV